MKEIATLSKSRTDDILKPTAQPLRFESHVDLQQQDRAELVVTLNRILAGCIDLFLQTKQAHWNVRGRHFQSRHELFDAVADRFRGFSDEFAERIGALGGYAQGTVQLTASGTFLPRFDLQATDGQEHIKALVERMGSYCSELRKGIEQCDQHSDPATEDLLTEALRTTEKDMWFLESHLNA